MTIFEEAIGAPWDSETLKYGRDHMESMLRAGLPDKRVLEEKRLAHVAAKMEWDRSTTTCVRCTGIGKEAIAVCSRCGGQGYLS